MAERLEPGSDQWWAARLGKALAADEARLAELDAWAKGKPPLPVDLPDLARPHYRRLLELGRVHLANVPAKALAQRLDLTTFRTAAAGDDDGDRTAEALWARLVFSDLKRWAIVFGRAYTLVETVDGAAVLTAENPRQTITEQDPANPAEALAGLKVYRDAENNRDVAVLYRPGYRRVAYRKGTRGLLPGQGKAWAWTPAQWEWQAVERAERTTRTALVLWDLEDQLGRFEAHLPTLRRINHGVVQRMVLIAAQAFRQRALKGAPKNDPETDEPIDYDKVFSSDPGELWLLPQAVELWESGQADFTPVLTAVKDDVRLFAVGTATPIHVLQPDAANGSAEGAALLRETLVFDAEDVIARWKPRAALTLSLAFEAEGDATRAALERIESVWAPAQRESLQARAATAVQLKTAGVPWRARMEYALGASPAEVRRWAAERTRDAFLEDTPAETDGSGAPEPPPAPTPPGVTEPPAVVTE